MLKVNVEKHEKSLKEVKVGQVRRHGYYGYYALIVGNLDGYLNAVKLSQAEGSFASLFTLIYEYGVDEETIVEEFPIAVDAELTIKDVMN